MPFRFAMPLLLSLAATAGFSGVARAALGEGTGSVAADAIALGGVVHIEAQQGYDAYDVAASAGTRVREYVNQSGIVFAVTWSGPAPPDLSRWLGGYFAEYARALATLAHPGLRRSLRIETADGVIVEAGGHLRAYSGRAYLEQQMPPGLAPANLR